MEEDEEGAFTQRYLAAFDFDETPSFDESERVLCELIGAFGLSAEGYRPLWPVAER